MSYWIVHILRFPLMCELPACHIGALRIKKNESQALINTTHGVGNPGPGFGQT